MPARTRKTRNTEPSTEEGTDVSTDTDTTPVEFSDNQPTEEVKRTYSSRVTAEDVGLQGGFQAAEATEVPRIVRERGRSNVFDEAVRESYVNDYVGQNKWVQGRVASLLAAQRQARNAATYLTQKEGLDIGVECRAVPDSQDAPNGAGVLYFRGKGKRHVKRNNGSNAE